MSRDFDGIIKEINKQHKELHDIDNKISKDLTTIDKDIASLKKEIATIKADVRVISNKIDLILEILNNFTLMIMEDGHEEDHDSEDYLTDYDTDQTWVPDQDEWTNEDD